ncbi:MAG: DUF4159 domain-containing protein [Micavibrio sp.]|nr:MAG: DUF4159 domain-containing protein [Micavibrio sp.]
MPGFVTFLFPIVLAGLAMLPIVWLLLRLLPPEPKRIRFPAVMLMRDLKETEKPTQYTPWWLLLLRVMALALFILAMAEPVTQTAAELQESALRKDRPVLLLVDNDWVSGQNWALRQGAAMRLVERVQRSGRNIIVVPTASPYVVPNVQTAASAKGLVQSIQPQPWAADYTDILENVRKLTDRADTFWVTNGFHAPVTGGRRDFRDSETYHLLRELRDFGDVTLIDAEDEALLPTLLRLLPAADQDVLRFEAVRLSEATQAIPATAVLYTEGGRVLGQQRMTIGPGEKSATGDMTIDSERRNMMTHARIQQATHAGGTFLVDENWRFRPVGVAATEPMMNNQGYLNDVFYMIRALAPYTDLHTGRIREMLAEKKLAVLMLSDDYPITDNERALVQRWVEQGGMLVRFAGPTLAAHPDRDTLLPVRLRYGGRDFDGSLTWDVQQKVGDFAENGPFAGIRLHERDSITVSKQVLAEPSLQIEEKIWVRLEDNTPLVTGAPEGRGQIVLFHTTANPVWSDLSLSGAFVEMLRRLVAHSVGVTGLDGQEMRLMPARVLDGYGRLQMADSRVEPVTGGAEFRISPKNPPGFYGQGEALKAFNLIDYIDLPDTRITHALPSDVTVIPFEEGRETTFKPHLAIAVLMLLLADFLISLYMRGLLPALVRPAAAVAVFLCALAVLPSTAAAQPIPVNERDAIRYTNETWIAYVITGDPSIDDTSRSGLDELRLLTGVRTSADIRGVVGVNPETDVLTYFPLIYWPVTLGQTPMSRRGRENVQSYLENGGLILFDTRDGQYGLGEDRVDQGRGAQHLRRILRGMHIPALYPVPQMHALRRSYYLLNRFPGRYDSGDIWVQQHPAQDHDGVPSIIIGGNDWAGAWSSRPRHRLSGGERQREMAYRFGVNVIMMALTGNYKIDQIHTQELLNRIGR